MDNKNYNVDDILAEIKSRKLREKRTETQAVKPQAARPQVEAAQAVAARPKHVAETEPETERKPAPKPEAAAEQRPVPESRLTAEPRPERKPEPRAEYEPLPEAVSSPVKTAEAPTRKAAVKPESFNFDPDRPQEKKNRNPLEFDGEARSITDRARSRPSAGIRPALQKFDFKTDVRPENTASVSAEKKAAQSFAPAIENGMERTRVIPAISAARDIKTDEIRKMDFAKLAAESQTGFYFEGDEDDGVPVGSVIDYSEYNSVSDRRDVQTDIARVKLWLFIRVSLTVILTAALFMFTLGGSVKSVPLPEMFWPVPETMRAYLLACTILAILTAVVNSSAVGGGLMGLFKMHANSDTLAACAVLAAVGQGVAVVANPELAEPESLNLYFCIAALAMLFNGLGKMTMINRILSNFKIVASDKPKKALVITDIDEFCHEFFKDSIQRPTIVHSVKAEFFTDFLGLSYSDKYDVGINRVVAPVCLAGSVMVALVTYFLTRSTLSAVSAMTAILCVCATLSSTFIENVPLAKLTKKLAPQGGMVSGNKAVEDFCDTKAVVLSENDLFPRGNVHLHGIRAFSQARIDEAILDAASVLCEVNGALGPVFLEMIGGKKKLLKKVDNIVFENAMGISAWVDGRRVLIGNRRLMINHGIELPDEVFQQKQVPAAESEPLFLSNSGEACAQFSVSYHIDEELAHELDRLSHSNKLIIVHTTDANITADKICELYGYPIDLIRILPAEWHPAYSEMTKPRETAVAEAVYTGKAPTMLKAILACMAARSSILSATVIQLVQIVLGYALCTFLAFMGQIGTLNILQICVYQLFWFVAIFIVQQVRQS